MQLLNRALSAGTREASRGFEGGARSALPDARERGKRAEVGRWLCSNAEASVPGPEDSRSGGWGGGAHPGGGSRTGKTACAFALSVRSVWWSSTLHQSATSSLCSATVDSAAPGKWARMLVPLLPRVPVSLTHTLSVSRSLSRALSLSRSLALSLSRSLSLSRFAPGGGPCPS